MTSKQRAYLKGQAHHIEPVVQIGKNGITPEVTKAVDEALEANELVKISVLSNCMEDMQYMAEAISERTNSEFVQKIGKKFVLYRESKKNPKIELPKPKKTSSSNMWALVLAFVFAITSFGSSNTTAFANAFGSLTESSLATVTDIIDGDSFIATLNANNIPVLIRMIGVDTQNYAPAMVFLNEILLGRQVMLTVDPAFSNQNARWSLAYVNIIAAGNPFVNELMLSTGNARLNAAHSNANRFRLLQDAERSANTLNLGIWDQRSTVTSTENDIAIARVGRGTNINTAAAWQLAENLEITTTVANRIITYREENPFNTVDEIVFVDGFTREMFTANSNRMTVSTNINTATADDLRTLGGLTTAEVNRIIAHRDRVGGFRNVSELLDESLITRSRFNSISDFISITNVTSVNTVFPHEAVVNINTATENQLVDAGLSSQQASAIVRNRVNYSYKTLGELTFISSNFSRSVLDRLSDNMSYRTDINNAFRSEIESLLGEDSTTALVNSIIDGRPYRNEQDLRDVLPQSLHNRVLPHVHFGSSQNERVNINTASVDELRDIGLTNAQATSVRSRAGRMHSALDIPMNLSEHDDSITLRTNINTASATELLSLHRDMTQSMVNSIISQRQRVNFGDAEDVRTFFESIGARDIHSDIGSFIVVR